MPDFIGVGILLVLLLLGGSVMGWVSFLKTRRLEERFDLLRQEFQRLAEEYVRSRNENRSAGQGTEAAAKPAGSVAAFRESENSPLAPSSAAAIPASTVAETRRETVPADPELPSKASSPTATTISPIQNFTSHLQEHWMIWLGGICVGLAGIFMVRYSIEVGWLGPSTRIALAILTGLSLHAAAEWLRRIAGANPAFAALAGGASITLYAALLAAMHLYQLLSPGTVFILLAAVSIFTMMLAIQHGPVLAILGILGAYIVPALVSTGSGNIAAAMIYALIITASALWLMTRVYRSWLWLGTVAGALAWWAISLSTDSADGLRGPYLAVLAYGLLAMPQFDWPLVKSTTELKSWREYVGTASEWATSWVTSSRFTQAPVVLGLILIIAAQALSITREGFTEPGALASALTSWLPLTVLLLIAARKSPVLAVLPWLALLSQLVMWVFVAALQSDVVVWPLRFDDSYQTAFCQYAVVLAALHFLFAAWHLHRQPQSALWASLMLLSPLLWLTISYALTSAIALSWQWSVVAVVLGIIYMAAAGNRLRVKREAGQKDQLAIWLVLAGHLAYSLAVVIMLKEATLTVALAAQAVSLAWVIRRFDAPELGWLLKLVLAAVVIRLTFNPWLLSYPTDVHWSFYTYGGATVLCGIAAWLLRQRPELRAWLEAVTLHLLVLTLLAEVRYWLYSGDIFHHQYGFVEAAINANAWGALGLVYHWRSRVSSHLKRFYQFAGNALLILALANYWLLISLLNPLWGGAAIGYSAGTEISASVIASRPIFNLLLLAYGLPVLLGIAAYLRPDANERSRRLAAIFVGVAAFIFINLEIRHLWQSGLNINDAMKDGELYTYSAVWLIVAVATLLFSSSRSNANVYRVGVAMLGVVIAKLFLIDMSGLEGILRVASFMGLGLSLLGLGYLLQKAKQSNTADAPSIAL